MYIMHGFNIFLCFAYTYRDTNSPHNELEVETVAKNLTTMPRESQLEMLKAEVGNML